MRVRWQVTPHVKHRFHQAAAKLAELEQQGQEWGDEANTLREQVRCLPNFPNAYNPDRDTIVLEDIHPIYIVGS